MQKAITIIQRVLFVLGLAGFIAAAVHMNDYYGETFWRIGMAAMITSIALGFAFRPAKA